MKLTANVRCEFWASTVQERLLKLVLSSHVDGLGNIAIKAIADLASINNALKITGSKILVSMNELIVLLKRKWGRKMGNENQELLHSMIHTTS